MPDRVTPPLPEPHPHNLALIDQVHRQLSVGLQRFLRQHGFGSPIRRDILHPLYEMNEDWIGVRFECHDPIASVSRCGADGAGDLLVNLGAAGQADRTDRHVLRICA